jgi:predicted  nucleic acid-binding Zn-ribbon protein
MGELGTVGYGRLSRKKGDFCGERDIFGQMALQAAFIVKSRASIIKIMRNLSLFLLLALALTAAHAQMSFDLNSASYQSVSGFWDLFIPVTGGVNPLAYNYQSLPATWLQAGNNLEIPTAATSLGGTWAVKVIVSDALGNSLQRSLLIKISGGAIYIGDYPYSQVFTFTSSGAATVSPASSTLLTSSTSSSSTSSASNSASSSVVNSFGSTPSTAGVISLQSAGTGSNTALPTDAQLDAIINSGDSVTITQTVQKVIASTLSCTQKTGYLDDFLGRIQSYIVIEQTQASQLANIITSSQKQISQLNDQINNYSNSITNLGIASLQGQLSSLLASLQTAYNNYNAANVDLTPYNLNITANLQSVSQLTATLTATTAQLKSDNQSLANTETLITSLQQQLATAQANKASLQARILTESSTIAQTQSNIDFLNADNVKLNNQINAINANKDTLQSYYQSQETQAQNLKNTISSYQAQQAQYTSQIAILKTQLQQATLNTDPTSLNSVTQTIANLNLTIPALKQQIDYVKFNCNGVVNYTVSTLNGTITYTFASSVFSTYVTNEFGKSNTNAAQALLGPISKVTLTPITIFAPAWVGQFGASFANDLQAINATAALPNSYFFSSDFSCASTATLYSGAGVVKSIVSNYVTITTSSGTTVTAILGACSNILLLNESQPKVGNNVYWRGLAIGTNTYQVYSALLF